MLTQSKFLNFLKQFKKLTKLIFKNNYITSFLQIAKLEILPNLKSLTIKDNPISSAQLLKEFIVYRFPDLKEFNGTIIDETHRNLAKSKFKEFDNILMIPTKLYCENLKSPQSNKIQEESIEKQAKKIISTATQKIVKKDSFELCWTNYLNDLVIDSLNKMKISK